MPATASLPRVLLVEDHFLSRTALVVWLTDIGHYVIAVSSVAEALAAAGEQTFDFVISDIGLPDGNGRDLVRTLRKTHDFRAIAISGAQIGPAERELSRVAGFIAHLEKPFSPQELNRLLSAPGV